MGRKRSFRASADAARELIRRQDIFHPFDARTRREQEPGDVPEESESDADSNRSSGNLDDHRFDDSVAETIANDRR